MNHLEKKIVSKSLDEVIVIDQEAVRRYISERLPKYKKDSETLTRFKVDLEMYLGHFSYPTFEKMTQIYPPLKGKKWKFLRNFYVALYLIILVAQTEADAVMLMAQSGYPISPPRTQQEAAALAAVRVLVGSDTKTLGGVASGICQVFEEAANQTHDITLRVSYPFR